MKNSILIIEDEELMRHFLEQRLKKEGLEVETATDGKEAMDLITSKPYSLIISDLMLPFVSGFELIDNIRSDARNSETPILILSAMSADQIIVDALSVGANDFLSKPFSMDILMTKIKLLTGGHEMLQAG